MKQLFLVTGNKNKLKEWQQLIPADLTLDSIDLDLPEIQSLDPEEIVADKAKRAFEVTVNLWLQKMSQWNFPNSAAYRDLLSNIF